MWSGPRNISTALMRSWGSRPDCVVSDEPLYGHYLSWLPPHRRAEHPGADDVIGSMDRDWRSVAATLTGPVPGGKPVWYQKHMAHHLTPDMDLGWVEGLTNCFLIRDPAAMIVSFSKVIPNPKPEDLGLPQQVALFERIKAATGHIPAVIESSAVLKNPEGMLITLCEYVGVPFDPSMLAWEPGPRETDGIWAPHWYARVHESTGFEPPSPEPTNPPKHLHAVIHECTAIEQSLLKYALRPFVPGWIDRIRKEQSLTHLLYPDNTITRRVRYGMEREDWGADAHRCHDCGVAKGEIHVTECDGEECPRCGGQAISCDCDIESSVSL